MGELRDLIDQRNSNDGNATDGKYQSEDAFGQSQLLLQHFLMLIRVTLLICCVDLIQDGMMSPKLEEEVAVRYRSAFEFRYRLPLSKLTFRNTRPRAYY